MKFYHTCPEHYFDKQTSTGDWIPHKDSTWLCDDPRYSYHASQSHGDYEMVIVEFDLDEDSVEDHSDMPVCQRTGRSYYIYRGNVPAGKYRVHYRL